MVRTLRRRLADGRTRKLIATILAGKMLGVIAVLFVINQIVGLLDTPASAQTVSHQAGDLVNPSTPSGSWSPRSSCSSCRRGSWRSKPDSPARGRR